MIRLLRNYFFWSYERGSFHYDVMVTAILLFIFVSPHFIDFKDKPVASVPRRDSQVLVKSRSNEHTGEVVNTYEVRAQDLGHADSDYDRRTAILHVIQPITGDAVHIDQVTPVLDAKGNTVAYDVTVSR